MELDTGEALLRTFLELSAAIWSRRMVSGMTFNEALVSNLLLDRQRQAPQKPMTATELCEKTNIRKSQMNGLIGSLEQQGYLARSRSETDRRLLLLTLTPKGEAAYLQSHRQGRALIDAVVEAIGEKEARALTEQLESIHRLVQAELERQKGTI